MARQQDQGLEFTQAHSGDGVAMRILARAAYQVYVDRIGQEPAPMTADYETIATAGEALLVWKNDELVGMLVTKFDKNLLLIENIAVDPARQGSGLGTELLAEAERVARDSGLNQIRLYTNEAMVENMSYYVRRGYEETHRNTEDGYRRVHFTKLIRPEREAPPHIRQGKSETTPF